MRNNDQIRNSVIAGAILIFITLLFEKGRIFLWKAIVWFFQSSLSIPVWLFSILVIIVCLSIFTIIVRLKSPEWESYKEDKFDRLTWRWNYNNSNIINVCPYCPIDDTLLTYRYIGGIGKIESIFICDTCKREFGPYSGSISDIENRIKRQIDRKIRKREYLGKR